MSEGRNASPGVSFGLPVGGQMGRGTLNVESGYYLNGTDLVDSFLPLTGGTLQGPLTITGNDLVVTGPNWPGLVMINTGATPGYRIGVGDTPGVLGIFSGADANEDLGTEILTLDRLGNMVTLGGINCTNLIAGGVPFPTPSLTVTAGGTTVVPAGVGKVFVNSVAAVVLVLPQNDVLVMERGGNSNTTITVTPGVGTINGLGSFTMVNPYQPARFVFDGAGYGVA